MRPIPATMRDQTEFLPLGPPLRTRERPPIDMVKLEAAEFEMYDASHEAPDAVWDQCTDEWVHRDHLTAVDEAGWRFCKGEIDVAKALNRIEAVERAANPPQTQSPELAAALEAAQRAMMAHFFGTCPQVGEGPNGPSSATGMMLLQEQANREMNKALRGRALDLSIASSNPDRWNYDELRRKLGLGQIS